MNETVTVAKEKERKLGAERTLSTGVRIRLRPVALGIWQDALRILRGKEPRVPLFANPDKGGRMEENPNDPDYQAAMRTFAEEQNRVSSEVLLMFGTDLIDGMPTDDTWLSKLKLMARTGTIDLSAYNLDDPIDREFVYKKFIAVGPEDAAIIGRGWGPTEEEVAESADYFPDSEAREQD